MRGMDGEGIQWRMRFYSEIDRGHPVILSPWPQSEPTYLVHLLPRRLRQERIEVGV